MISVHFATIEEALSQPTSRHFWVSGRDGRFETGNPESFFGKMIPDEHLTFDISNHKVLVNVSLNGSIKYLTIYRNCYRTNADPACWPGVWLYKDFTKWGPYAFTIKLGENSYDLSKVDWPFRTALLDNIFPLTVLQGEQIQVTLITYTPIAADGAQRPRGVIYGALIENTGGERLSGSILLPEMFNGANVIRKTGVAEGLPITCDVDMSFADSNQRVAELNFDLAPGQTFWAPALLFAPGEDLIAEINSPGSLEWLNATWSYFKNITGKLTMPADQFTAEFFQRAVFQCLGSIAMNDRGEVIGSNWGTYPPTTQTWMKDMYYSCLPFFMLEPETFQKSMLWFLDNSIRHESITFKGGVTHSLSNALTPVMMAGLYYTSTGEKEFFLKNPFIKEKLIKVMQQVITSRKKTDRWLFPSDLISDGDAVGDYHTGSNLCAWYSFQSFSRILAEVYSETALAGDYLIIAAQIKEALENHNVIDGPFGKQYIEGVNADGSIPAMYHEAEESDTTLMPFYGYSAYDGPIYKNYTRFAVSEQNIGYSQETRGIRWGMHLDSIYVDASFPGYITGLANVTDWESMNGPSGYFTEIRKLTDVDGSVWWWPYPEQNSYGNVARHNVCGKCGWAAGVFAGLFITEFLGIKYDAPTRTLNFRPFSPSSDFRWDDFKFGGGRFSIGYKKEINGVAVSVENQNDYRIDLDLEVILAKDSEMILIMENGKQTNHAFRNGRFLDRPTVKISRALLPGELKRITITGA